MTCIKQAFIDLAVRTTCRDRRAAGVQLLTSVSPTAGTVPTGLSGNHVTASYRLLATISSTDRFGGGMVLERVYMAQLVLTAECLTPERLGHRSPVAQIIQYAMRAYILAPIAVSNADAR